MKVKAKLISFQLETFEKKKKLEYKIIVLYSQTYKKIYKYQNMIDKILGNDEGYKFGDRYKFKSLKVYSDSEWMFNSTKKYRTVFDKGEVDYISAEFQFYNKLFDEKEWEAEIRIKAYDTGGKTRKELCNQVETVKVTPDKNTVTLHKGWGTDKKGGFWKKGSYIWEAYINDFLVGSKQFYVEDVGIVTPKSNPYFDIDSFKLYNGPYDGWGIKKDKRKYLKKFNRTDTLFIWGEVTIRVKTNLDFHLEMFINFFDTRGNLKGRAEVIDNVKKGSTGKLFSFQEGWGSKTGGSWKDDHYSAQIVFMDSIIAMIEFDVGLNDEEGVPNQVNLENKRSILEKTSEEKEAEKSLEEVMQELDNLIGLQEIKTKIKDHITYLEFIKLRQEKGFADEEQISLHSVFTGNPGTGKTTVVNLLGKIYQKMGLLTTGQVIEVDRADLVAEYIGQTAPKVKKAIEDARGGILFIDEAYSLTRDNADGKDFGREVIEIILKEMSDGPGNIAIMVAGYPVEMGKFMDSNPGLQSRFKYKFHFSDYTPDELYEIALFAATKKGVTLQPKAAELVKKLMIDAYRDRDNTFGNARYAQAIIAEGKMNLGLRLMKKPDLENMTKKILETITLADIQKIKAVKKGEKLDIPIDEELLKISMEDLNQLVGIENIKKEVSEEIKLVRYYRETGKDILNRFSLHTVFKGNPGTGKTTVARIIARVYKALGLLERGHCVETDREGLIAGYTGQTAIKTKEMIDKAMGGVLFIDEAYALTDSAGGFGNEAIEVILKNMEDKRGQFAVVVAGYPDNMDKFLLANPGLKSRFDRTIEFTDFSIDELYSISQFMLSKENLIPNEEAKEHLTKYLASIYSKRDKHFGNAREVRKTIEKAIKNQHLRMASMDPASRTAEAMGTLTLADLKEFEITGTAARKGQVGFMYGAI